jgi:hypothetical protein
MGKNFWARDHGIKCDAIRNTLAEYIKNFGNIMQNPLGTWGTSLSTYGNTRTKNFHPHPTQRKKMNLLADMFSTLIDCMHNLILDMVATIL